jgi:hypothetical protein
VIGRKNRILDDILTELPKLLDTEEKIASYSPQ